MYAKTLFLRWVFIANIIFWGAIICYNLNLFSTINKLDFTKLSFVILIIFFLMTIWCGKLTWDTTKILEDCGDPSEKEELTRQLKTIENKTEHGWFASTLCEMFGLTGTLIGLIKALVSGFGNLQSTDPEAITLLLKNLSSGMSTAFVTTLVGIICNILLRVQYHHLNNKIDGVK
jgi:hypothetical protein